MPKILLHAFWQLGLLLLLTTRAVAGDCTANSGSKRVALLELYTSEGCSSCPPADRWLGELATRGFTADRVVPLALHVDYWDYIGWRDPFANPLFSARQRQIAKLTNSRVVYTPQFLLDGRDFRAWRDNTLTRAVEEINRTAAGADIKLSLKPASGRIEIAVTAKQKIPASAALYVAAYESGLSSSVRAGENRGEKLQHDYVVREWRGPIATAANTPTAWQEAVALKPEWVAANMGVVVFVQDTNSGAILQALQLPVCTS